MTPNKIFSCCHFKDVWPTKRKRLREQHAANTWYLWPNIWKVEAECRVVAVLLWKTGGFLIHILKRTGLKSHTPTNYTNISTMPEKPKTVKGYPLVMVTVWLITTLNKLLTIWKAKRPHMVILTDYHRTQRGMIAWSTFNVSNLQGDKNTI